ncbi:hypothetical protein Vqi01_57550 [Micromonospora qiuiae]|uniref:Uncharacterized protein n=1 Tax=Micromonospora qiuiae TaxID=502268 RepID=A0ABQ4JJ18_9ACTN|nr:hypothetical protein [Micromonospora qiuiae]GIJ30593.1 hypothetical protein Vqi01_57550 [Micromonospora qiuiae]
MTIGDGAGSPSATGHSLAVPLIANSVASPPRLVYGALDLRTLDSTEQGYAALYFEVAGSGDLGRVTFEGLDAVRGARGEYPPYDVDRHEPADWVFVVQGSAWLRERHDYEMRHYTTPLLETHQHYLFAFHDEFVEAVAEGIWLDLVDRDNPFTVPAVHPLSPLSKDLPAENFTSTDGLRWQLRRSDRTDAELVEASRYCSQRVYQFDLTLDGASREAASIWIRTRRGRLVSRFMRPWPVGEVGHVEGLAQSGNFADQWETYLGEVAQRRRQMDKRQR